jgi:hypothetical protein
VVAANPPANSNVAVSAATLRRRLLITLPPVLQICRLYERCVSNTCRNVCRMLEVDEAFRPSYPPRGKTKVGRPGGFSSPITTGGVGGTGSGAHASQRCGAATARHPLGGGRMNLCLPSERPKPWSPLLSICRLNASMQRPTNTASEHEATSPCAARPAPTATATGASCARLTALAPRCAANYVTPHWPIGERSLDPTRAQMLCWQSTITIAPDQSAVRRSVMGVKYLAMASGRSSDSEMNMAPESPASDSAWATLPRSSLSTS